MSEVTGFFTRLTPQEAIRKKPKKKRINTEVLGLNLVQDMNPDAKSPNMAPIIDEGSDILLLGEYPLKEDDAIGEPFSSQWGKWYQSHVGECSIDNICRTTPSKDGPTEIQIEAFRTEVTKTILGIRPKLIIACGSKVITWLSPGKNYGDMTTRGRRFVIKIGDHTCWAVCVLSNVSAPRIMHESYNDKKSDGFANREMTKRDIAQALAIEKAPPQYDTDKASLFEDCKILDEPSVEELTRFDQESGTTIFIDLECMDLLPYNGEKIQSIALTNDAGFTLAMPLQHPRVRISSVAIREIYNELAKCFRGRTVVAHNIVFELQWLMSEMGDRIAFQSHWYCTERAAHALDTREGKALDFLCRMYLGFALKSQSSDRLWDKPSQMREMVEYNALDTKYLREVYLHQCVELKAKQIDVAKDMFIQPALAMMMVRGVPQNQEVVDQQYFEQMNGIDDLVGEIRSSEQGYEFRQLKGMDFEPNEDHMKFLVHKIILKKKSGKGEINKELLASIQDKPQITRLQKIRRKNTLLNTYLKRSRVSHPTTHVFADGLFHPQVFPSDVISGRLATRNPNLNWPKRNKEMKKIRQAIQAPPGHWVLSTDLGQIEGRVIACLSQDQKFVSQLNNGLDIHKSWAKRLAEVYPPVLERFDGNLDDLRGEVKGSFVFALFFGSGAANVSKRMDMPIEVIRPLISEFWEVHHGVKEWHNKLEYTYEKKFYIENLFGQRFYGPLSYNQRINLGVQSSAAFICLFSLAKLARLGVKRNMPWLTMIMNIHDDNTTIVPDERLEETVPIIAREMVVLPFDCITVPITASAEKGRDWCNMELIKEFETKDFATE